MPPHGLLLSPSSSIRPVLSRPARPSLPHRRSARRRVYEELRAKLPQAELPELVLDGGEKELMPRFAEWLGALGAELPSRCLLVLDGLDQVAPRCLSLSFKL
eukprot:tig00000189_g14312.t1